MRNIIFLLVGLASRQFAYGQSGPDTSGFSDLIQKHVAIVNDRDSLHRAADMPEVYAIDIHSVDPSSSVQGHQGMEHAVLGLQKAFPGAVLVRTGPVDAHHNVARFPFSLIAADKKVIFKGWDVVVFLERKIHRIYTFIDN